MDGFFNSLLNRISHYHLMNYLIPGCALCFILTQLGVHIFSGTVLVDIVICYLVGLVNGRVSSVIVEYLALKTGFITFIDHSEFRKAKEKDKFISILNEDNNMYRAFVSVFLISVCVYTCLNYKDVAFSTEGSATLLLLIALLVLFLFAYRKQTKYILTTIGEVLGYKDANKTTPDSREQKDDVNIEIAKRATNSARKKRNAQSESTGNKK